MLIPYFNSSVAFTTVQILNKNKNFGITILGQRKTDATKERRRRSSITATDEDQGGAGEGGG